MLAIDLPTEARLAEAISLLDEMSLVLLRLNAQEADICDLQARVRTYVGQTPRLPLAEAAQCSQDLREAVRRFGFDPANALVATAWADLVTALDEIFVQEARCLPLLC